VPTFAAAGYPCPQYKNPTDYFMHVACESRGVEAMVAAHKHRWASAKRSAFSRVMPPRPDSQTQEVALARPGRPPSAAAEDSSAAGGPIWGEQPAKLQAAGDLSVRLLRSWCPLENTDNVCDMQPLAPAETSETCTHEQGTFPDS
jgi:hypothetical protein